MQRIIFDNSHRQKHFDFFNQMDQPHFNLTANVDISVFQKVLQKQKVPFTPAIVFLISKTANAIKAFRWRIRQGEVFEHPLVHPSFSVRTKASDVFSFCYVDFQEEAKTFIQDTKKAIFKMQENPSFEDQPGRDDYLFLSSIPWVSFTSLSHAMHYHPVDSVPRITWGKFFTDGEKTLLPFSVQAHHAVVDGQDMGKFFQLIQQYFDESVRIFSKCA